MIIVCSPFSSIFLKFFSQDSNFFGIREAQTHPDALIAASNLAALLQEDGVYEESAEAPGKHLGLSENG